MADPPAGYDDMLADAEAGPYSGRYSELVVPDVGVVSARRPRTNAVPLLAMAVNGDLKATERADYSHRFVHEQLADGEWERLNTAMMDDELPADTIELVTRKLATWGTARPYMAVMELALNTAHMWRNIRLQFWTSGGVDPMALPHMHIVLDATEKLLVDSMVGEDGQERRARFNNRLYPAPPVVVKIVKGRRKVVQPPPGFSPEEMEASWRSWTSAQGVAG